MGKKIIYIQDDGQVALLIPSPEVLETYPIEQVGIKDVPAGKRFGVFDDSELPFDVPQEAWIVNEDDLKDGVGGESNEFD